MIESIEFRSKDYYHKFTEEEFEKHFYEVFMPETQPCQYEGCGVKFTEK